MLGTETAASLLPVPVKTAPGCCSTAVGFLHQVSLHPPACFCGLGLPMSCRALALATGQ